MTRRAPGFLDENEAERLPPADSLKSGGASSDEPMRARGPMLLDPEPDAAERLDVGWRPETVMVSRRQFGAATWVAVGFATLVIAWIAASIVSVVLTLFMQSPTVAIIASVATLAGFSMVLYAAVLELRSYWSLRTVDQLRAEFASTGTTLVAAQREGRLWLQRVSESIPDAMNVERLLAGATSVAEVRAILRSQVADRLLEATRAVGRRAAIEGGTLVAICPHPAWDGLIAGLRGLQVIRQIAALHGMRPGLIVSVGLVRRVAWTAAGSTGLAVVSQGLADHALSNMPVIKHLAAALPETGLTAVRLYRLAIVVAMACSPVPD